MLSRLRGGFVCSRFWNTDLPADSAGCVLVNLSMSRYGCLPLVGGIHPHRVATPLTQELAFVPAQMLQKILPLHDATSPAGVSTTSVLTLRCMYIGSSTSMSGSVTWGFGAGKD